MYIADITSLNVRLKENLIWEKLVSEYEKNTRREMIKWKIDSVLVLLRKKSETMFRWCWRIVAWEEPLCDNLVEIHSILSPRESSGAFSYTAHWRQNHNEPPHMHFKF